jgi:DUF971 family protein
VVISFARHQMRELNCLKEVINDSHMFKIAANIKDRLKDLRVQTNVDLQIQFDDQHCGQINIYAYLKPICRPDHVCLHCKFSKGKDSQDE